MKKKRIISSVLSAMLMLTISVQPAVADTSFTGEAKGFASNVKVEFSLDESGKITTLTVDDSGESYTSAGITRENSVDKLIDAILAQGSTEGVDTMTSATFTSNAIVTAITSAMNGGAAQSVTYTPGVYTGTAKGRIGDITVEVTVSDSRIEKVEVTENQETAGLMEVPIRQIPEDIVTYQTLGVDSVSGATVSSNGIVNAVANALEQAGADTAQLRAVAVNKEYPAAEDMTAQIVVVGGGMAGLSAASAAADAGADVILLEKLPMVGGSLNMAMGAYQAANSQEITAQGNENTVEMSMAHLHAAGDAGTRQPDYEMVEFLVSESGKTLDYFIEDVQIPATIVDNYALLGGATMGSGFVDSLEQHLAERNVRVMTNSRGEEIVMSDGKAVGVRVSSPGGEYTVYADQIILATGGTSRDLDRMYETNPGLRYCGLDDQTAQGNEGDGYRMLEELDAKFGPGPYAKTGFPCFSAQFGLTWINQPYPDQYMVIDDHGLRFYNEEKRLNISVEMIKRGCDAYYMIFDGKNASQEFFSILETLAANDDPTVAVKASSVEELAQKLNINEQAFAATFNRYQGYCATGIDLDYAKSAANLVAYQPESGLYAVKARPGVWGTYGGALTDKQFHVELNDGSYLPNVYAVGEMATSTLYGEFYCGYSLSFYATAGRIAAETAAEAVLGSK